MKIISLLLTLLVVGVSSWLGIRSGKPASRQNSTQRSTQNSPQSSSQIAAPTDSADSDPATVVRTIDGDTLIVRIGEEEHKMRILMIDTPESVHEDPAMNVPMGKTASDFTKQYLPAGKEITLEYDQEKTDQYGRLLAYIRVDDIDLGAKLVEEGLAKVVMYKPNKARHQAYLKLQKEAKKAKRGVWAYPYDEIFKK
ncbi:MAG: thermonuclease family protein [Eubacteriales bacterium]|nr:thermonuclease family protein [Eubacteriales bacterium]